MKTSQIVDSILAGAGVPLHHLDESQHLEVLDLIVERCKVAKPESALVLQDALQVAQAELATLRAENAELKTGDVASAKAAAAKAASELATANAELATLRTEVATLKAKDMNADLRAAKIIASVGIRNPEPTGPRNSGNRPPSLTDVCQAEVAAGRGAQIEK